MFNIKRPVCFIVSGLFLGELVSIVYSHHLQRVALAILVGFLAGITMRYCCHYKERRAIVLGVLFLFVEWFGVMYTDRFARNTNDVIVKLEMEEEKNTNSLYIEGRIYDVKKKSDSIYCYIDQVKIFKVKSSQKICNAKKIVLMIENGELSGSENEMEQEAPFIPGCNVYAEADYVRYSEKRNEGGFDEKKYYDSIGVQAKLKAKAIRTVKRKDGYHLFLHYLYQLKAKLCARVVTLSVPYMSQKYAQIYNGILLGEKEEISSETIQLYQMAGIAHILSISGLHISMAGYFIFRLLRKRHGILSSVLVSLCVLESYVLMVGNTYSVKRAFVMLIISMIAGLSGRSYDLLSAMSIAFGLIFFENPLCILHTGVCMSFLALIGIGVIYEEFDEAMKVKHKVTKSLVAGMCINMATRPVLINSFNMLSMYSAVINLCIIPFMGIVIALGTFGILLSYIWFWGGRWVFHLGCMVLLCFDKICHIFLKLPGAVKIVGDVSGKRIILYYIVIIIGIVIIHLLKHFPKSGKILKSEKSLKSGNFLKSGIFQKIVGFQKSGNIRKIGGFQKSGNIRKIGGFSKRVNLCIGRSLFIIIYVTTFLLVTYRDRNALVIKMIDVGQGESIFIHSRDVTALVDAGSSSKSQIEKYTIVPFLKANGVQRLDYLIITHTDLDHISGAKELLNEKINGKNYVKNLVMQDIGESVKDEAFDELIDEAKKNNVKVILFSRGKMISDGKLQLRCIWPEKGAYGMDKNTLSIVFELEYEEFKMLFTGDLSSMGEEYLVKKGLESVDLLKVGHHGSKGSSSKVFLELLSPKAAIISCGIHNRYGHPSPEVIERLGSNDCDVYRTDLSGCITIKVRDGEIMVSGFCGKK